MLFKKPIPKNFIIEIISLLFILLFVYASISKLLEFNDFQTQLGQSPLLAAFAVPVSYGVIGIELATAGLLAWEKTRKLGLYTAYLLMVLFRSEERRVGKECRSRESTNYSQKNGREAI